MIEVFEVKGETAVECAANRGIKLSGISRIFVMREKEDIGIGVLQLIDGTAVIKHLVTDMPFAYYDLLVRAVLAAARNISNTRIRIEKKGLSCEKAEYFARFGFKPVDEHLEVLSGAIDLSGTCKGKH